MRDTAVKLFVTFLSMAALVSAAPAAQAALPSAVFTAEQVPQEPTRAQEIAVLDGSFYALYPASIMRWAADMDAPEVYGVPAAAPGNGDAGKALLSLAAGDGKLWLIDIRAGRVGEADGDGVRWLENFFDLTGGARDPDGNPYGPSFLDPFVRDGSLYWLSDPYNPWLDNAADGLTLTRIDLATGAVTANPDIGELRAARPYKSGQLLALSAPLNTDDVQSVLTVLDAATLLPLGKPVELTRGPGGAGGLAYDAATDSVYYSFQQQVWRSAEGRPFEAVGYVPLFWNVESERAWAVGDLYAVADNGQLMLIDLDPSRPQKRTLRVRGGWEYGAVLDFMRQHPDVAVIRDTSPPGDAAAIVQAITTGDSPADVYIVDVAYGLRTLIQKGFAAGLGSTPLAGSVKAMYPQIRRAVCDDAGNPCAYPLYLSPTSWSVDFERWEMAGQGSVPQTYAQLLDAMERWETEKAPEHPETMFWEYTTDKSDMMRWIITAYIRHYERPDQPLDFTAPVLRDLLEHVERMPLAELSGEERELRDNGPSIFYSYNAWSALEEAREAADRMRDGGVMADMLPPVFEAGQMPIVPATLEAAFINAASPNQDLALRYVEFLAADVDYSSQLMLRPDFNDPVEAWSFSETMSDMRAARDDIVARLETAELSDQRWLQEELEYHERWLADPEPYRWLISEAAIARYRQWFGPYLDIAPDSPFAALDLGTPRDRIYGILQRYSEGQLDLDAMLREMSNLARRMYLEGP